MRVAFLSGCLLVASVSALSMAGKAEAIPAMTRGVPLARLLKNVAAYQKAHPRDPKASYALGRAYYAAFTVPDGDTVPVYDEGSSRALPHLPDGVSVLGIFTYATKPPKHSVSGMLRASYAWKAVENLRRALGKTEGLAELTLGCVLEQGAKLAPQVPVPAGEAELTKESANWISAAARSYARAFEISYPRDSALREQPIFGYQTLLAYEAGNSYQRLAAAGHARKRADIDSGVKLLVSKPRSRMVTPLIFSLGAPKPLTSLLAPRKRVAFDLDGSGRPQTSSWLQPGTALLTWDPERTGKITSGRQLFGSATWWMLFDNAYAALDALDDNRDGWLMGKELDGLSVWIDRNQNGVSEAGEVIPIERTHIAGIATQAMGESGLSPMNPGGLRLHDGRVLPTYDWTFLAPVAMPKRR